MSAGEEMVREQLDRIISSIELRVEQPKNAGVLAPHGDDAQQAQNGLALMLRGLEKLRTLRKEFHVQQPSAPGKLQLRGRPG